jgi:hypothetical protein
VSIQPIPVSALIELDSHHNKLYQIAKDKIERDERGQETKMK